MARSAVAEDFRIIPAYAGSTEIQMGGTAGHWDHPRIRGEHDVRVVVFDSETGSSPHTRGAPPAPQTTTTQTRIIPAYAGSTFPSLASTSARRDHPRIRGEHGNLLSGNIGGAGSSPHTRGAHRRPHRPRHRRRIIPAYAGSTCGDSLKCRATADHPRIRGEHSGPRLA